MTNLDIVNKALRRIGSLPASSMLDTGRNQAMVIEEYEDARDEVLRMFPWPCAIKRGELLDMAYAYCGWQASFRYQVGEYCVNDTGKVYVCITAGTSATSGGPTGATANITDGTVHWDYDAVNDTDTNWAWVTGTYYDLGDLVANANRLYACIEAGTANSLPGPTGDDEDWEDDPPAWTVATGYVVGQYVVANGNVYLCDTDGTSAATGLGPATTAADIVDNTTRWDFVRVNTGNASWAFQSDFAVNQTIYACQYAYPSDCLKIMRLASTAESDESGPGDQYLLEGRFVYTDTSAALVKYIRIVENPTEWDQLLIRSVALRLASLVAFDVTGKNEIADRLNQEFAQTVGMARGVAIHEGAEAPPEPVRWEEV